MSYLTPDGWAQRCTFRDDTLPHQIRLFFVNGGRLVVSCICQKSGGGNNQGNPALTPFDRISDLDEAWRLYRAHLAEAGEVA